LKKLLIANRGEIAVRIIRTAREMGIATVAVFSEADRGALHARMADESVFIGPPEPSASYLSIPRLLEAAGSTGCDAIHPGYGFLSERDAFAQSVVDAGLIFVGPTPQAMRSLGSKIQAKQLAQEAGAPLVPGFFLPGASDDDLIAASLEMGLPVMVKASAGGGGRGMRAVHEESDLPREIRLAREEAVKAFGDGEMMIEKLISRPRHIEVQVLADHHGQAACLFERECSLQRRHQKLIEEAPSPIMTSSLWARMREASESLIRRAGYTGAGTVEFMVDEASGEFYFLEVNARLQVEHPVTELITGLDLVRQQLLIAMGQPMEVSVALMRGDRTAICGHAIEVRVVAEDPAKGFLPSIGKILGWAPPRGLGLRWDTGFEEGAEVSRSYDSLLAKLIAHGGTRDQAIHRAICALEDTHILGVHTSISFSRDALDSPWFRAGKFDTGSLDREMGEWTSVAPPPWLADVAGYAGGGGSVSARSRPQGWSWDQGDGFRSLRA
jgi:acetyl/propionyl-CoA carboxylase alpha subunit